jgi:hypothetical protein
MPLFVSLLLLLTATKVLLFLLDACPRMLLDPCSLQCLVDFWCPPSRHRSDDLVAFLPLACESLIDESRNIRTWCCCCCC